MQPAKSQSSALHSTPVQSSRARDRLSPSSTFPNPELHLLGGWPWVSKGTTAGEQQLHLPATTWLSMGELSSSLGTLKLEPKYMKYLIFLKPLPALSTVLRTQISSSTYCCSPHKFTVVWNCSVLHVLCDRCVADGVGCSGDAGLAAIAAATAVQAGHVDPVEVIVVLPASVAQQLVLTVLLASAKPTWNG